MSLRRRVRSIIFEAETREGRMFDVGLLWLIILSTGAVLLESVPNIRLDYHYELIFVEWVFTFLFTTEYLARIFTTNKPLKYIFSFYGLVDIVSILPTYMGLMGSNGPSFLVVRSIRLIRVFRVLKLANFVGQADVLKDALRASRFKILVFIYIVVGVVVLVGSLMYVVEGDEGGFTSIPTSMYWAVVTLTTVGYGDIAPVTVLGKAIASVLMILGYGIIAVPTGIVTAEMTQVTQNRSSNTRVCCSCFLEGHHRDASYCRGCGELLNKSAL